MVRIPDKTLLLITRQVTPLEVVKDKVDKQTSNTSVAYLIFY